MLRRSYNFLFLLLLFNSSFELLGQGCSDAGFCTMGAMKPDQDYSDRVDFKLRSIEINGYRGTTTLSPVVYVLTVDATVSITKKLFFQAKVPYQMVQGSLGETRGMGDLSFALTQGVGQMLGGNLSLTLGTKIPTNNSSKSDPSKWNVENDLPMYYQTSLGSYDLIAGAAWINRDWLVATGIQVALTENENDFRWGAWRDRYRNGESPDYINAYDLANGLKRGTDVMIRVERNFRFTNYSFNVGLLPIYRITKDERLDFNTNQRIKEDGTTGLALSALVGGTYHFNVNSGIKLILGRKITDRKVNPDGLTRDFVSSVSYVYRF